MYNNPLDLKTVMAIDSGERVLIPRINLMPSDTTLPFSFKICQFCLPLAFWPSKEAQGQTLDCVGIYLTQHYLAMDIWKFESANNAPPPKKGGGAQQLMWYIGKYF